MLTTKRARLTAIAAAVALSLAGTATADAATQQQGLVNVSVSDVNVPIGVAANVCDVQANVLAQGNVQGPGRCTAISDPTATGGGGGGNTTQEGLVNIAVSDVNVPIGIAANICQVQANVLAAGNFQSPGRCTAISSPTA
jgi:hypothetical protein